jgi:hypothetical protein
MDVASPVLEKQSREEGPCYKEFSASATVTHVDDEELLRRFLARVTASHFERSSSATSRPCWQ